MGTKPSPIGSPSFIELGTPSGSQARKFFGDLFGWASTEMGGENSCADTPTIRVGMHPGDPDACMVVYFAVSNLDAAIARVRELGGTANEPGPAEPGFGRMTECRDPQNVRFGLHQQE
jgi:uncharacterized protein